MALGALDRGHVARWLRHFRSWRSDAHYHRCFHIQPDVVGLIGASLVFGAVIGAGVGGPMADHLGRKKLMLADMMIIAAGACISALARGPAMLFIGQLLVGIGSRYRFPCR
jgi:Arabinose efflux permease